MLSSCVALPVFSLSPGDEELFERAPQRSNALQRSAGGPCVLNQFTLQAHRHNVMQAIFRRFTLVILVRMQRLRLSWQSLNCHFDAATIFEERGQRAVTQQPAAIEKGNAVTDLLH